MKSKRISRIKCILFALVFSFTLVAGVTAYAVDVSNDTYTLNSNDVVLNVDGTVTVTSDGTLYKNVTINCAAGTKLTIEDLNIQNDTGISAIVFTGTNNTLTVNGLNLLDCGSAAKPAIAIEDTASVTIGGAGELRAKGGDDSAAIGAGSSVSVGTITINSSGKVIALGGVNGAGIGGGNNSSVGTINILNGEIGVEGGAGGAGIGGGATCAGGEIIISDGHTLSYGTNEGAGIGYGNEGYGILTIDITGGIVETRGGEDGAGIGYGNNAGDGSITIDISENASVLALSSDKGAGIGSSSCASGNGPESSTINISGGWVLAIGYDEGSAIGAGDAAKFGTVNISGGVVNAWAENYDDIGNGASGIITGGVNISDTAVVFLKNNKLYSSADVGTHSYIKSTLNNGGSSIPNNTEIVLESIDGLSAYTMVTNDIGEVYSYLPNGTYFFSKDDGDKRTSDFTVFDSDITPTLDFLTVIDVANDTYTINQSGLIINAKGTSTIKSDGALHSDIAIMCAAGTKLTIEDVNIFNDIDMAPIALNGAGNTLTLVSDNILTCNSADKPAIQVEGDAEVTIGGTGKLEARAGSDSAAIGSGVLKDTGTIKITEGTIDAYGGDGGAGIGGGYRSSVGTINISGGTIFAQGKYDGAGIGSGDKGAGGSITISGGNIEANGKDAGAGIGFGGYGNGTLTIDISGGDIDATGGNSGAGIGYGDYGKDGKLTINISGGNIYSISEDEGAGIGGGDEEDGNGPRSSVINISGGYIEAYGYCCGSGIGAGDDAYWGTINISGGVTNAWADSEEDIGEGCCGEITGGVDFTDTAIIFPLNNELYDSTNTGTHRFAHILLSEGGTLLPVDTKVVLESTDGVYAKTWVSYDEGEIFAYIPDGTYFFSKDNGLNRTKNFTVSGGDVSESLEFASVLLENLTINQGTLSPSFDSTKTMYTATVSNSVSSLNLVPISKDADDTITINGSAVDSGSAKSVSLNVGENNIAVVVTDGTKTDIKNTYNIKVTRQAPAPTPTPTPKPTPKPTKNKTYYETPEPTVTPTVEPTFTSLPTPIPVATYTPTPEPTATPGLDVPRGTITGKITDSKGNSLVGYSVELPLFPPAMHTNGTGVFTFSNVPLIKHILVIKSPDGNEMGRYTLDFSKGESTSFDNKGDIILINFTDDTIAMSLEIGLNHDESRATIKNVSFTEKDKKGSILWWLIPMVILLIISGLIGIRKYRYNR